MNHSFLESHLQRRHGVGMPTSKGSPEAGQAPEQHQTTGSPKMTTALERELEAIRQRLNDTELHLQNEIKSRKTVEKRV